jgi:protein-disulfide isomerase
LPSDIKLGKALVSNEDIMTSIIRLLASTAVFAFATLSTVQAGSMTPEQKTEMQELIRSYLLDNPEILREMATKLEAKDKQAEEDMRGKALSKLAPAIFKTETDPSIGNPKGDVTIVEFMDYNCGWCKKSMSEVSTLLKSDDKIRVVFKEFPIFGEHSEYAARAALAAAKQNKYWDLHQAMFSHDGQVTTDVVNQLAEGLGLDMAKLKTDIESKEIGEHIAANMQLGKELAINGTPAFIIDDQVYGGYVPLDGMLASVAQVRANGCKLC